MRRSWAVSCFLGPIVLAVLLILGLSDCQNLFGGKSSIGGPGSLTVAIDADLARSILPDMDMAPASFRIEGVGPEGAVFSRTIADIASTTISKLAFGSWSVVATALNEGGTAIGEAVGTIVIHSNSTAFLPLTVRPYTGLGSLSLVLSWPAADVETPEIEAVLVPVSGDTRSLSFSVDGASGTASYSGSDLGSGFYTLAVKLKDNGALAAGAVEVVRIVKDSHSSGCFTWGKLNKQGGTLDVNISANMEDPLGVGISGASPTKAINETLELRADLEETLRALIVWYVNGEAVEVGGGFSFSTNWQPGFYRIDAVVVTGGGLRAGSASTNIEVVADPSVAKIIAGDSTGASALGYSASLSGDYAIAGAPYASSFFGAAFIYHRIGPNSWDSGFSLALTPSALATGYNSGSCVSICGDYAIINTGCGVASIYHRTGTNSWDEGVEIKPPDGSWAGTSVAIGADCAMVVCSNSSPGSAGFIWVFNRTGVNSWEAVEKIMASDGTANDGFGSSISIKDELAIISAPNRYNGSVPHAGAAYIFRKIGGLWQEEAMLLADDPRADDCLGESVAIDGNYAIAGARRQFSYEGAAYIFHRSGESWGPGLKMVAPSPEPLQCFGSSVAVSSEYAIIGAPGNDGGMSDCGSAYLYRRTGDNSWGGMTKLKAFEPRESECFGSSVALDGNYCIIGALGDSTTSSAGGAIYIIRLE